MAGQRQSSKTLKVLVIFIILSFTEAFEMKEHEWEEFGPDIAALRRLKSLHEHMFHVRITGTLESSLEAYHNATSLLDGLQDCRNFTACVFEKEKDFNSFVTSCNEQLVQDLLLTASEISYSYSQKLLLMTDEEKSTRDQVQEEYSMDPHYSVKVNKDCLNNVSCVPEVDSYTVVKIFGHVSEDGQTVSGLSASSLANLIMSSSLKEAPVFSLHGNTTLEFHHLFIRSFRLNDIKAVLETTQDNHLIYQVMNQPNSISSYRIPQRPIDHSTQYDHQQIIIMEDDLIVRKAAEFLYEKHPLVSVVYVLDENQNPKLIHGESVPLSDDSRLVLVGHGAKDESGEMKLSGYSSKEVARIIQKTNRVSNDIKTTSVVACKVGSDETFIKTLLRELHNNAKIQTELHVRDAIVQVIHTGEKITQEITPDGLQWRHKDDSKKLVATLDRNGDVIIRNEPGNKGEAVFANERNFLAPKKARGRLKPKPSPSKENSWPKEPERFINPEVFEDIDQNVAPEMISALDELQALTWGFFHSDELQTTLRKVEVNNPEEIQEKYLIGIRDNNGKIVWINDEDTLKKVLSDCYEIKSGEDIRNVIRHYAKNGENKATYLMVNDWIYEVNPKDVYVYPVGKRLNNNQIGDNKIIDQVKKSISVQVGRESYEQIRLNIKNNQRYLYADYTRDIFLGKRTFVPELSTEAWFTTYFTATVIAESVRNFRTFPLTLMVLDMIFNENFQNLQAKKFFFEDHSMARGGSWVDTSRRGFVDSKEEFMRLEYNLFKQWADLNGVDENNLLELMTEMGANYQIFEGNSNLKEIFEVDYRRFKEFVERSEAERILSTSGTLGGHDDGHVTLRDLRTATELENTFKHESYYSRASASLAEDIHAQLQAKYGDNLAVMHLQEGSTRIENGQFICTFVPEKADAEPVEFRAELSPGSLHYAEKMLKNIDTAVHDMESSISSREVNEYVKHAGSAVGTLGLLLGMKGAIHAFEEGDIKDGVIATLQTVQGVTAMTSSIIGKEILCSETRIGKAVATVLRNPMNEVIGQVIPLAGIGFGIYNVEQDLERGDTLGYVDAGFDLLVTELDVVEFAQPELEPFIEPVVIVLSVIRMTIDDIYMGIKNELDSLPKDAGVLDKLRAFFVGFGKGIEHFLIHVASIFYNWHYDEIEEGRRLVAQISDYHKYFKIVKEQNGTTSIDFSASDASWNGGGIDFCLADQGQSELCMDYFVSSDESPRRSCWDIDSQGSKDIILGLGESHELEHQTLQNKVLLFIPAGSVTVVSGYKSLNNTRYGSYKGNRDSNRFFAIQEANDTHAIEVMLTYYYTLYGEPDDDIFFLGPQKSYVEGSSGKDTYIIPENGGKTIINNYDSSKAQDTLHFSADYSHISVSKSGQDVVLTYKDNHTVTVQNWFQGELYRHMNMMSGDGVLFEISSIVVSSVQLVARGINKGFMKQGVIVNASQPLLCTVTNIFGSRYDDVLIGNEEKNLIDGGGGEDHLIGGEGEDMYIVKGSSVLIENYSTDNTTDMVITEANLHTFSVMVEGDDVHLNALYDNKPIMIALVNWFRSPADRHLLVATKDLITFTISDNKTNCIESDPFHKCIRSHSIDYSNSTSPLEVDLQKDEALNSVIEVRGSKFNDVIKGNKEHNVFVPGEGDDYIEGRGGEDWYVITPGQGVKTINNSSPDRILDMLFLKEQYHNVTCSCKGQNIAILVHGRTAVILQNWFDSKKYQHLQIKTSDGITAGLISNFSSCGESLLLPLIIDYRNQEPEPLQSIKTDFQKRSINGEELPCYTYKSKHSFEKTLCGLEGKVMMMNNTDSVKEMYGSSGFDIMVGNSNNNLLDSFTGGAVMSGGEGKDTYIIKYEYGNNSIIDNFAKDLVTDTVLVDMDFLGGSKVFLDLSTDDLNVTITAKEERLDISLVNYNNGPQHQHLAFQSSDGVSFKLKSTNSSGDFPLFQIEAFKVTLQPSQVDCRLDLNSYRNLSKVHTVQGCPSHSNNILGNNRDNILIGGWKNDALDGGRGNDTLIGGQGSDILVGGMGDDILYGEDGNDTLIGNSGSDVFIPGPGADLMDGGSGRDSVLYRGDHEKGEGVYVNLLTGQGRYSDAEGDVLKDVETVIGTIYSDILVSGYESSLLKGSDGNDILVSTGGDYLVGGDGHDIYMLAFSNGSVTIDNCAKDNATDILYWSLQSAPIFDCHHLSDSVVLSFTGIDHSSINIKLQGWSSNDNQCGHLVLVFRDVETSVDILIQDCQYRWRKHVLSLVLGSVSCIVFYHFPLCCV
ncbi:uncharacterized protein KZ484_005550 [Pholidichthys leucotaenia]